jgi:hypothetical protein
MGRYWLYDNAGGGKQPQGWLRHLGKDRPYTIQWLHVFGERGPHVR